MWIILAIVVGLAAAIYILPLLLVLLVGWVTILCASITFKWAKARKAARAQAEARSPKKPRALPVLQVMGALIDQNRSGPDEAVLLARMRQRK